MPEPQAVTAMNPRAALSFGDPELCLITLLALAEPKGISLLNSLTQAVSLHEPRARKYTIESLRVQLRSLADLGYVTLRPDGYWCNPGVGEHALRAASARGLLFSISSVVREKSLHIGWQLSMPANLEHARFEVRVALAQGLESPLGALEYAVERTSLASVAASIVVPFLDTAFDEAWLVALPSALRRRLLDMGVSVAEAHAYPLGELYACLARAPELCEGSDIALTALAGLALFRGDFKLIEQLAALPGSTARTGNLRAGLAMAWGRAEEAAELLAAAGKRPLLQPGTIGFLQTLALVRTGKPAELALAQRIASAGVRKENLFSQTFGTVKSVIEAAKDGGYAKTAPHVVRPGVASDCLALLTRVLFAHWFPVPHSEVERSMVQGETSFQRHQTSPNIWLAAQYAAALAALAPKAVMLKVFAGNLSLPPFSQVLGVPLTEVRPTKAAWEASLEELERIAEVSEKPTESEGAAERLIWRVEVHGFSLEPYLQKASKRAWTQGRRFPLKNLLDEATRRRLPARDAKLAEFVRGQRENYYSVEYHLARDAWPLFIGHPLVFLGEAETPIEVIRGAVQLVLRSTDEEVWIHADPPDLKTDVEARLINGKIVVFSPEAEVRKLLRRVGEGLRLPKSAEPRALATLERLSLLLPVQSSEKTQAKQVPSDPTPCFRLLPRNQGLAVSLFTRPLGPKGPEVGPGSGASALVSRIGGETLQALRDLALERQLGEEAIQGCPALAGNDTSDESWQLLEPVACLELMSSLQALSERVHVEWPEGSRIQLKARVSRGSLQGRIKSDGSFFSATGTLVIDESVSLELSELLALVKDAPGKFVQLEDGDYIELEQDLRELLGSMSAASTERAHKSAAITLPKSAIHVLDKLTEEDSGFSLDARSSTWREQFIAASQRPIKLPRGLKAELRPYQLDGFRWLARLGELGLGACLADDMGLGKTVQAIALLLHRAPGGPQLIVAPTSVCDNWRRELERFSPSLRLRLYTGRAREEELSGLKKNDILITSYALLQQDAEKLAAIEFNTAILDEAQFIKNAESQRAQAAFSLTANMRVVCTGTPVENHVGDLYSLFRFVLPDLLGTWPAFNRRFGANLALESRAATRRALTRLIRPFLLRRTKAQVLQDLPPLTEIQRNVTLSPEETVLYETLRTEAVKKLASAAKDPRARFQVLAEITRLRRLCCHPGLVFPQMVGLSSKLASFMELVEELRSGGHRALVFSQFVDVLTLARRALDERSVAYQYLDGSTPVKERARAVEAFQAGEAELFLISLRAGGFGLNLTGADYVIHLDPWWNPAVEQQASDRAHRIGQTRPVTVYRLVATGTVEERIVDLHQRKRALADALLEDTDQAASLSVDELRDLLDPN